MLRAFLIALFLPLAALAQGMPEPLSDRINDFADLLPPEVEQRISESLQAKRVETGVHDVVVTLEKTRDNGGVGEPIADYAKRLFNQWGIGDSSRNDGILILVARTDREMRIALGSAYPVIWDNAAQRVIDRYMLPEFREDRYAEGIEAGVAATFDLIVQPFLAGQPPAEAESDPTDWVGLGIFALFFSAIVGAMLRHRLGDLLMRVKACPNCGHRTLQRSRDVVTSATSATEGHGLLLTRCSHCDYHHSETYRIAKTGDSDSGSSGFGGGSSSGGGATGRW